MLAKSPLYRAVAVCVRQLAPERSVLQEGRVAALQSVQEHMQGVQAGAASQQRFDALFDRAMATLQSAHSQQAASAAA